MTQIAIDASEIAPSRGRGLKPLNVLTAAYAQASLPHEGADRNATRKIRGQLRVGHVTRIGLCFVSRGNEGSRTVAYTGDWENTRFPYSQTDFLTARFSI